MTHGYVPFLWCFAALVICAGCTGRDTPKAALLYRVVPGLEAPPSQLTYEQRRGEILFQKYCAVCHGQSGEGDGFNAFNLDPRPTNLAAAERQLTPEHLREVITEGGRGVNLSSQMPAYGTTLSHEQIEDLVEYVPALAGQRK